MDKTMIKVDGFNSTTMWYREGEGSGFSEIGFLIVCTPAHTHSHKG